MGYIFFVNNDTSVRFFTNISETMYTVKLFYILLERSLSSASAHICYIKIQTEMAE